MAKQLCPDATDARCNGGVRQSLYISVHKFNQKLANSESTAGIAADFSNRIGIGTTDIRINVDDQAADNLCRIPTRAWPVEFVTISWQVCSSWRLLTTVTGDVRRSSLVRVPTVRTEVRWSFVGLCSRTATPTLLSITAFDPEQQESEKSVNRTNIDARQQTRYPVAAPVSFWWPHAGGSLRTGEGFTRNISTRGVHISTAVCPPAGVCIQMTIFLPPPDGGIHGVTLQGEGVVLRVERASTGSKDLDIIGFVAAVQFHPEQRTTSKAEMQSLESVLKTFVN
ncbi:MAG TPA: hypothetical protein VMD97_11360 [Candidatus Aquilonibacter sp.]|nr:hypothetical protein [Candidatus Aquilonibacter sp.]